MQHPHPFSGSDSHPMSSQWNKFGGSSHHHSMMPFAGNHATGSGHHEMSHPMMGGRSEMSHPMMSGHHEMSHPMMTSFPEMSHPMSRDMRMMERDMQRNMQRNMTGMEREMQRMMRQMEPIFHQELAAQPSRPASVIEHYSLMHPIRVDTHGNRWLNLCFDLRSYKPEEIKVELNSKERCIQIDASHEVKDSAEHYIKRHYARKFFLPAELGNCDLTKLQLNTHLTHDGLLELESALPKVTEEQARQMNLHTPMNSYNVPINVKHI